MKAPLVCQHCGEPLDKIYNAENTYPVYGWDSSQRKYVLIDIGSCHMECSECGSDIQRDYVFDIPEEFTITHDDATDSVEDEEVNVNGTVYTNAPISGEAAIEYIQEEYKVLLEAYPDLKVVLLEQGEHDVHKFHQDYCIEPEDGHDMATIIQWWRQHR